MNHPPYHLRILYGALLFVTGAHVCELRTVTARQVKTPSAAQQRPRPRNSSPSRPAPTETTRASSAQKNSEKLRRRHRQQAVLTLTETADAARKFEDQSRAARVQSLAADALWRFDEPAARSIFQSAWETATEHDRAARQQHPPPGGEVNEEEIITSARDEVLAKVAARDVRLAEKYLREVLDEERKLEEASGDGVGVSPDLSPWGEMSGEGARRLELAEGLLRRGDAARAAGVITPATRDGVSADLIDFMLRLRASDAARADALFLGLLRTLGANANATGTNDLLLLSSYVVSPRLLVVFDAGASQNRAVPGPPRSPQEAPPVAPEVRGAFYDLAARVLAARANAAFGDPHETAALFFATARLLPFFEREAPNYVPNLRAQYAALAGQLEAERRDALAAQSEKSTVTPKNPTDPLRPLRDAMKGIGDKGQQDSWRLVTVNAAARQKLWARARDVAAEIEDAEAQRTAMLIIKARQIENLSRSYAKDAADGDERAAAFVRDADVPPLLRAWGYAQAAEMAESRGKRERAVELLGEAAAQAGAVENNSRQRVAASVVVAKAAAHSDPQRAWENLSDAVRAANELGNFTGDDASLDVLPPSEWLGDVVAAHGLDVGAAAAPFRLDDLFATMARLDFERALAGARALSGDVLRASALISVARAELEKDALPPKRQAAPKRSRVPG